MAGIYQGLVDDTTSLAKVMKSDLWVVQKGTYGPFADVSKLDPSVANRVASVPGVRMARSYTYQIVQRTLGGAQLRVALVGMDWPDDTGAALPLVQGRPLRQPHGEIIVDASLGLEIGSTLTLAGESYRVVGLTRGALTTGGDAAAFLTQSDAQDVMLDTAPDAVLTERERRKERLRDIDLGRAQPFLADLLEDPQWRAPVTAPPPVHAVMVTVDTPAQLERVRQSIASWPDAAVFTQQEEESLLLRGVVQKARMQLAMFSAILILTSSVLFSLVIYNMTLDKTHEIAVLKLMGAKALRIGGMVLQQSWLMGLVAYGLAVLIGTVAFPHFPRRVVLTEGMLLAGLGIVAVVTTLSSLLGVAYALRVDAGKVLES